MEKVGVDVIEYHKVIITWRKDIPLAKQIASLRKICPELNNLYSSDFLKLARSEDKFVLGGFVHRRVGELIESGEKLGLNISVEN